jgi:hypothetical protein
MRSFMSRTPVICAKPVDFLEIYWCDFILPALDTAQGNEDARNGECRNGGACIEHEQLTGRPIIVYKAAVGAKK